MNTETATVLSTEEIYQGGFVTWFHGPGLTAGVEPGQFVMTHCSSEGTDPMFARAFSYHRIDGDRFALLYNVVGHGTTWLSQRQKGDPVRLYGPLGKGFRLPEETGNLLLIAGGVGVAPMVDMAERAVAGGHHVQVTCPGDTQPTVIQGEMDTRCGDFSSDSWSSDSWSSDSWSSDSWSSDSWSSDSWSSDSWSSDSWSSDSWSSDSWSSASWDPAPSAGGRQ